MSAGRTPDVTMLDGRVRSDEPRPVIIYALCDPESGERRYIGKTTARPARRLIQHGSAAKRSDLPVGRWIRKLMSRGLRPRLEILEIVPSNGEWALHEAKWIATLPKDRRLNLTSGGEGLPGLRIAGTVHGERIKLGLRRGQYFVCEACGDQFWRRPSDIKAGNCRFCSRGCYHSSLRGVHRPLSQLAVERGVAAAAAIRNQQTHCKRGHPLSGSNLYQRVGGPRICKECRKAHKRAYRERHSWLIAK